MGRLLTSMASLVVAGFSYTLVCSPQLMPIVFPKKPQHAIDQQYVTAPGGTTDERPIRVPIPTLHISPIGRSSSRLFGSLGNGLTEMLEHERLAHHAVHSD